MTDIVADLHELAEPWPPGSFVKSAIDRAAKAVGFAYWRTSDIWYGKARRIENYEREAVAAALDKKRREAARNEFHELKTRLAVLESRLNQIDPDFHRETIDQIGQQVRGSGAVDRSRTRR